MIACPVCKKSVATSHLITGPSKCRLFHAAGSYFCAGCGKHPMSRGQVEGHILEIKDLELHFAQKRLRDSAGLNDHERIMRTMYSNTDANTLPYEYVHVANLT